MNKKSITLGFLLIFSFLFFFSVNITCSISGDLSILAGKVLDAKGGGEKEKQARLEVGFEREEYLRKLGVKSIEAGINLAEFDKSAFGGENLFYLGIGNFTNPGKEQYAVTLSALRVEDGQNVLKLVPYAPESVVLNYQVDDDGSPKWSKNPVYGQRIRQIALDDQNDPIVVFNRDDLDVNKQPQVCLIRSNGTSVITHKMAQSLVDIRDANGDIASEIVGLSSGGGKIFAAVTPNNVGDFAEENSGFAVLTRKRSDDKNNSSERLTVINASDGTVDGNLALKLDLSANQMIAITQDAEIVDFGNMYWDSNLQRLFIGLVGVHKAGASNSSGAISILVGRIGANGELILEPVSRLTLGDFVEISSSGKKDHNVFGFSLNGGQGAWNTSVHNLGVMHTSTGFSYLILNGGGSEDANDSKNKVYALPIVKSGDAADIGKIADKNNSDFSKVIDGSGQLLDISDSNSDETKSSFVGGGYLPLTPTTEKVENMFVEGDSVFICLAGDRTSDTNESGIFKSTALFDENGKIFAWTKWQRVMGSTDKVFGGGLDRGVSANSGNYWYLTSGAVGKTVVKVTQWGFGESRERMLGQRLVHFLEDEFKYENAGVHQVFNFDEMTPGFNNFSMMVATGYKKVVLFETGKKYGGSFDPTYDFADPTKYNIFEDAVLGEIGPICCAEVSRNSGVGKKGWLFVGGYNGLAVLSKDDGDGWDADTGLEDVSFADFSFRKIGDFSHIRKLFCLGDYLYVVNDNDVYRVEMIQGNFSVSGSPVATGTQILGTSALPSFGGNDFISDFMICDKLGLVCTISGLFKTEDITDIANNPWRVVTTDIGPIQSFYFISSQRGGDTSEGNLYLLSADISFNLATVYRFQVVENDIKSIKEINDRSYFYQVGEFRGNFLTDGVFGFHLLPAHLNSLNFLKKFNISSNVSSFRSSEGIIDLGVEYELAYNVGLMVRNSATGAWVVPGDWGIRVQE